MCPIETSAVPAHFTAEGNAICSTSMNYRRPERSALLLLYRARAEGLAWLVRGGIKERASHTHHRSTSLLRFAAAASRASRSALSRSRFSWKAFCIFAYSVVFG